MDGQPLSEVSKWDLEDVYKYYQFLMMKNDHTIAMEGYQAKELDKVKNQMRK